MTTDITLFGAFLVGLFGSTHCLGMCGGVVSALTFGVPENLRRSPRQLIPYLLAYNTGRIGSYMAAGAIAGAVGATVFGLVTPKSVKTIAQWISGGFMIALGIYLGGWWTGLQRLEKWGGVLWKYIEPLGRRLLPVNHPLKALVFGMVWGWLPCGMVYAALAWSLSASSALQGGLLMMAFGLGTLPMMLSAGIAAERLRSFVHQPFVRRIAGLTIVLLGVWMIFGTTGHNSQHEHAGHALLDMRTVYTD